MLAGWYGLEPGLPAEDLSEYARFEMPYSVPPRGFGGPGVVNSTFSFLEWSRRPEVMAAWEELSQKHGLKGSPFGEKGDTWGLG